MEFNRVLEISHQCERLIYRFLKVLEGEQAKTADLFAPDGTAFGLVGRDEIRGHFGEIESVDNNLNVNISTNLVIDVEDENHVSATNYVTHYVSERADASLRDPSGARIGGELETPRSITLWSWDFKLVGDEWLIAKPEWPENVLLRKDVIDQL